jgi:hypothetical protein
MIASVPKQWRADFLDWLSCALAGSASPSRILKTLNRPPMLSTGWSFHNPAATAPLGKERVSHGPSHLGKDIKLAFFLEGKQSSHS